MPALVKPVKHSSETALRPIWFGLRLVALNPPERFRPIYYCWLTFVHTIVTIYYPLSMFIYIARMEKFESFALCQVAGNFMASCKIFNSCLNFKSLVKLSQLIKELDNRVCIASDEQAYFADFLKLAKRLFVSYSVMCFLGAVVIGFQALFVRERRMIFTSWYPFEWENSTATYHALRTYQVLGIYVQIYQNILSDTYPAILFILLKGHLGLLGLRVSKIGWNKETSQEQNYEALKQAIGDHQLCVTYYKACQSICSRIMLIQLLFAEIGLCMTAIDLISMKNNTWHSIYLFLFFICITMEIWLSCYAASKLIEESKAFTGALFSCNWMDQNARFKKILIIFMQNTQKPMIVYAGGICQMSLSTWLTVLKTTYSLFAVFVQKF